VSTIDRDLLVIGAGPVGLYAAYYAGPDEQLFPGHSSDTVPIAA